MGFLSSDSIVGLEIDSGEARAVELKGRSHSPTLAAWGRVPIPEGAVTEGIVNDPEVVGDALDELWARSNFAGKKCILGVSNQNVIVRFATFPKVPDNKLDNLIHYQAQDYIPLPLSSVVLSYTVVGETTTDAGPQLQVLLVAGKREMLQSFLTALERAGLKPQDIDVSSLALLRVIPAVAREGSCLLADISCGLTNILVTSGGRPRFARQVSLGLKEVAAATGCQVDDLVPVSGGLAGKMEQNEAYLKWVATLTGEIRSSLSYVSEQLGDDGIDTIILSGRGARLEGLSPALQSELGLGVINIQPLEGIILSGESEIAKVSTDFAVSIALARRGLEV